MTPSQFAADSDNFMTEPNKVDATQLYFMLPSEYLLDAVEMFDAEGMHPLPHVAGPRRRRIRRCLGILGQEASAARLPKSRTAAPTIRTPTTRRTIS